MSEAVTSVAGSRRVTIARRARALGRDVGYGGAWLASPQRAPRPAILMYHSIGGMGGPSARQFAWQMRRLATTHEVLPLTELSLGTNGGKPVVVVTFDDGGLDNYTVAAPVLDDLGLRATFFPVSDLLGRQLATSRGPLPLMSPDQVRDLGDRGHDIGGHTSTHAILPSISDDEARGEIVGCKHRLEDLLGRPVHSFAYPKGRHDERTRTAVRDAGFLAAVTVEERLLAVDDDPFLLPRIYVDASTSKVQFVAKLSDALPRYKRWRGPR